MTTWFPDPNDPAQRPCPSASAGMPHRLAISGPIHHRIMRCQFCGQAESTLRAQIAREEEE